MSRTSITAMLFTAVVAAFGYITLTGEPEAQTPPPPSLWEETRNAQAICYIPNNADEVLLEEYLKCSEMQIRSEYFLFKTRHVDAT